jgi:hypothetical protein
MKEFEKGSVSFKEITVKSMELIQTLRVPQKIHWRVFLDLADFAKRESKFDEARNLF